MKKWWNETKEELQLQNDLIRNTIDLKVKEHEIQQYESGISIGDYAGFTITSFIFTTIGYFFKGFMGALVSFSSVFIIMALLLYVLNAFEFQKKDRKNYKTN